MHHNQTIRAALCALAMFSAQVKAGYTLTAGFAANQNGRDARLFRAINDGIGTGTLLKALEVHALLNSGRAYFSVDDTDFDGIPDTVSIANAVNDNNYSFVRVGTSGETFNYASTPTGGTVQPNPWVGGVSDFRAGFSSTGAISATGLGAVFARLVMDPGTSGTISGRMRGEVGGDWVPVSVAWGTQVTNFAPVIISGANNLANTYSEPIQATPGAVFERLITATDFDAADVLSLSATSVPGILDLEVIGGGSGTQEFILRGRAEASLLGRHVEVPLTLSDGHISNASNVWINVTPEPSSAAILAIGLLAFRRR